MDLLDKRIAFGCVGIAVPRETFFWKACRPSTAVTIPTM